MVPVSGLQTGFVPAGDLRPGNPLVVERPGTYWTYEEPQAGVGGTQPGTPADTPSPGSQVGGAQGGPARGGGSGSSDIAIAPREIALEVLQQVPLPAAAINMNPRVALVALPTYFWIEGYDGRPLVNSRTVELPAEIGAEVPTTAFPAGDPRRRGQSLTVEVRVWPVRYSWSFGDGATAVTQSLGQRYPAESEVRHTYERSSLGFSGGYPIRLTVDFAAEFRVNGGPPQPLAAAQRTYDAALRVQEVQTVLTSQ
jgi:hypothetical protein